MARNRIRVVGAGGGNTAASTGTVGKGLKFRVVKRKPTKTATQTQTQVQTAETGERIYGMRDVTPNDIRPINGPIVTRSADVAGRPVRQNYDMADRSVRPIPAQSRSIDASTGVRPLDRSESPVKARRDGIRSIKPAKFDWS